MPMKLEKDIKEPLLSAGDDDKATSSDCSSDDGHPEHLHHGLPQLEKKYSQLFRDLAVSHTVETELNVITCIISYDSKHVVTLSVDERLEHGQVTCTSLQTYEEVFKIDIKGDWVVMNEIEQNIPGQVFAVPYSDNGKLSLLVVKNTGEVVSTIEINPICGLGDDCCKPIIGQPNPMVTACFDHNDDIYVSAFHREERMCHFFLYSYKEGQVIREVKSFELQNSTRLNFPIKTFYSEVKHEIYTFFR